MNISYQMPLISNFCICGRYLLHADKLKSGQADKLNNSQEVLELNHIKKHSFIQTLKRSAIKTVENNDKIYCWKH
jgi:hypothetical protein